MILPFKERFVEPIFSRVKIHSIREDKHSRWKPGRKIHMATGVRTKNYRCFNDKDKCKSTQKVVIEYSKRSRHFKTIYIDNRLFFSQQGNIVINLDGMRQLAKNDGFESIGDFFKWFNKDFKGKIIHWTDLRY